MRGWPSNFLRLRVPVAGVDPVVRGVIRGMDAAYSNGLAGRSGHIRTGERSDPAYGYRGYVAYWPAPALQLGRARTIRRSPYTALPATSPANVAYGLSDAGQTVMAALRNQTPMGAR